MAIETSAEVGGYLTPTKAAQRADISVQTIRQWASKGYIRAISTPAGMLFDPESIDAYRRERRAPIGGVGERRATISG